MSLFGKRYLNIKVMKHQSNNTYDFSDGYLDEVRERMKKTFAKKEELLRASDCMLDYIVNTSPKDYSDLSLGAVRNIVRRAHNLSLSDEEYLDVLAYFVGGRARLLDMVFTYFDRNNGSYYEIDKPTMKEALKSGKLYHPDITDELIENFENHIIITYKASDLGESLHLTWGKNVK